MQRTISYRALNFFHFVVEFSWGKFHTLLHKSSIRAAYSQHLHEAFKTPRVLSAAKFYRECGPMPDLRESKGWGSWRLCGMRAAAKAKRRASWE